MTENDAAIANHTKILSHGENKTTTPVEEFWEKSCSSAKSWSGIRPRSNSMGTFGLSILGLGFRLPDHLERSPFKWKDYLVHRPFPLFRDVYFARSRCHSSGCWRRS